MWLAAARLYAPRWTDRIHAEWVRNVLADNPALTPAQLDRTRRLMDRVAPGCLVTGHEARTPALRLPDPEDRHVLAAALEAQAPLIVTVNLRDFPAAALRPHGVQAVHPDEFLSGLLDEKPGPFRQAVRSHRASLRRPPKTPAEYLQTLQASGLPAPS